MRSQERVWYYSIDAEGHLWHEGSECDDPETLHFFMENLEVLQDGRFRVICMGEECWVTVEDCPYVVQRIENRADQIVLVFPGDYREVLEPATLFVGGKNVLYCKVRGGQFTARFNRTSYLDFARLVQFDPKRNRYSVKIGGRDFTIRGVSTK